MFLTRMGNRSTNSMKKPNALKDVDATNADTQENAEPISTQDRNVPVMAGAKFTANTVRKSSLRQI